MKPTLKTRELVVELRRLATEVDPYLRFAGVEARAEWELMLARWPSDRELREGCVRTSDLELKAMRGKLIRFTAILRARVSVRPSL